MLYALNEIVICRGGRIGFNNEMKALLSMLFLGLAVLKVSVIVVVLDFV